MHIELEIMDIIYLKDLGQTYLLVRQLIPGANFEVSDNSTLNNAALYKWFDIPRSLDSEGNQRYDVFALLLRDAEDRVKFHHGQLVEFIP